MSLATLLAAIKAWIEHLWHLHDSGIDVPMPPTPGGSPVSVPPGPPKPEPVAPPGAAPAPAASSVNGMTLVLTDTTASVKLDGVEARIASGGIWSDPAICRTYAVPEIRTVFAHLLSPVQDQYVIDACNNATMKGAESPAFGEGHRVNDGRDAFEYSPGILALPNDFKLSQLETWLNGCADAYIASKTRGDAPIQSLGYLPAIKHVGVEVAH